MIASSFLGAFNGAIAKILSNNIPPLEIVFFRNILGVLIILYTIKHTPIKRIDYSKFHLLILRGIFGFSAMLMFFYTISVIPLGDAITLNKTSPVFTAILAFLILHDKINIFKIIGIILGFIGVIFVSKPNGFSLDYPYLLGILGGFFAAAAYTTIGKIKDIYDSRVIVLSFMGSGTLLPILLFFFAPYINNPMVEKFIIPTNYLDIFLIILMAFSATASQWFLTKAYSAPSPTLVAIVSYSIIPFSIVFGVLLGDKIPDYLTITGIIFIILAGILAKKGEMK